MGVLAGDAAAPGRMRGRGAAARQTPRGSSVGSITAGEEGLRASACTNPRWVHWMSMQYMQQVAVLRTRFTADAYDEYKLYTGMNRI